MNQDREERPTVVVVGGGYGGVNVAKALDPEVEVVLVEPRDAFVHNVGALRAVVDLEFLPKIFFPYDRLLANGRVVRDRAVEVSADRVVVASGEAIAADYVVLATGSAYPFPAKSNAHEAAVGIELAGEIVAKWPNKHVTLLDFADDVLGDRFRPDLRAELRKQLLDLGVELVLGEGLRELPPTVASEF